MVIKAMRTAKAIAIGMVKANVVKMLRVVRVGNGRYQAEALLSRPTEFALMVTVGIT